MKVLCWSHKWAKRFHTTTVYMNDGSFSETKLVEFCERCGCTKRERRRQSK